MNNQNENKIRNSKNRKMYKPTSLLLFFILFIFFNPSNSFAQKAEIFNPKTTERVQKDVEVYLPYHTKKKLVSMEFIDGMAVMEGDIVLGPSHLYSGDVQFAVAIDGDSYRWIDGIIPYTIESGHPKRNTILAAIAHIEEQTNLRLVMRNSESDYVSFVTADGCSSRVGRSGGKQNINIGNCSYGSIVHEILHAAGLWHEQSRSDRDENIIILWDNIKSGKEHNFNKHVSDGVDIGAYDCNSIMHYSPFSFSKNGMPTITSTGCSSFGQRTGMSPGDIAAINKLYKTPVPDGLTDKPWYLVAKHSGKVIDIKGGGLNSKVNVQQYQLNNSNAQKFRFVNAGSGYYYIKNVGSHLVLDVQGGVANPGTNVWQYTKNGTDAQKWRLHDAGGGYYYIRSKLGDLNLEVDAGIKANGANIKIWSISNGGQQQQFKLKEAKFTEAAKEDYCKPLEHYWNGKRSDNFSTATVIGKQNAIGGKYQFVRIDGYVLIKPSSSEGKTTPLYLYYNNDRKDNFTTASPEGIRAAEAGGYRKAGIQGYVLKTVNQKSKHLYKPLWLYYHSGRKDNFVTASKRGIADAESDGYRKVRIEGYVRISNSANLLIRPGPAKAK